MSFTRRKKYKLKTNKMKREIKFRGLRVDGKGWVYGSFIQTDCDKPCIIEFDGAEQFEVKPETLGQLTGFEDKNGIKIYENDKVKYHEMIKKITFNCGQWSVSVIDRETCAGSEINKNYSLYMESGLYTNRIEVTGNIHDK